MINLEWLEEFLKDENLDWNSEGVKDQVEALVHEAKKLQEIVISVAEKTRKHINPFN